MRDAVSLLVHEYEGLCKATGTTRELEDSDQNPSTVNVRELISKVVSCELGNCANRCPKKVAACDDTDTLAAIVQRFEGADRIFVFHDDRLLRVFGVTDFIALVRASRCFEHLNDKSRLHAVLTEMAVKQFRPSSSRLHCCSDSDSLISVLKDFNKTGFSAVPIVDSDENQKCLSVLSVRDLTTLFLWDRGEELGETVLDDTAISYVARIRSHMGKATFPYIHVDESASMLAVIGKILSANIHRVLLTSPDGKVTGLVSMSDIARLLAREMATIE